MVPSPVIPDDHLLVLYGLAQDHASQGTTGLELALAMGYLREYAALCKALGRWHRTPIRKWSEPRPDVRDVAAYKQWLKRKHSGQVYLRHNGTYQWAYTYVGRMDAGRVVPCHIAQAIYSGSQAAVAVTCTLPEAVLHVDEQLRRKPWFSGVAVPLRVSHHGYYIEGRRHKHHKNAWRSMEDLWKYHKSSGSLLLKVEPHYIQMSPILLRACRLAPD